MSGALFKDAAAAQRKLKLFWIVFIWLDTYHFTGQNLDLFFFSTITASFSGNCSQSGCFLFLQDCRYFALQISGLRTLHESLEVPMEMKDLVYCRSASTGSTFQRVVPIQWRFLWKHNLLISSDISCACKHLFFPRTRVCSYLRHLFQGSFSSSCITRTFGDRWACPSCVLLTLVSSSCT